MTNNPRTGKLRKIISGWRPSAVGAILLLLLCGGLAGLTVQAQNPVITSFSANGSLTCSNLAPGSVAVIEWAATLAGPWRTNWSGLDAVSVGTNGVIQVAVPMFYRVRGVIPVTVTNRAPIAVDDYEMVAVNTVLERATSVFLANDVDPDGQALTITGVANAVNGFITLSAGTITFTPGAGFTGFASFTYTVSDGILTDTGLVTIEVK